MNSKDFIEPTHWPELDPENGRETLEFLGNSPLVESHKADEITWVKTSIEDNTKNAILRTQIKEYSQFQSMFPGQLLGLVEIGSRACGEAVSSSDRDFRIIIRTEEPYRIFQEHAWTPPVDVELSLIGWADINGSERASFGITNLGYVERNIEEERFPLSDHTALYQGCIIVDEEQAIQSFRDRYAGQLFDNIVEGYLLQTDWRVNNKLRKEADPSTLQAHLDRGKVAIPMVHTCCRIMRDLAHIDKYRQQHTYISSFAELDKYYRVFWPGVHPWFQSMFTYKMNEERRKKLFEQVEGNDPAALAELQEMQSRVEEQWGRFRASITD